jgi:hypothetical protein
MKVTEIPLNKKGFLVLRGERIGSIERRDCEGRNDCADIHLESGAKFQIAAAVDVGEQYDSPRIIAFAGNRGQRWSMHLRDGSS